MIKRKREKTQITNIRNERVTAFFFNLFLAALGFCCCARAFSSCGELGLLIAVASLVVEHGL